MSHYLGSFGSSVLKPAPIVAPKNDAKDEKTYANLKIVVVDCRREIAKKPNYKALDDTLGKLKSACDIKSSAHVAKYVARLEKEHSSDITNLNWTKELVAMQAARTTLTAPARPASANSDKENDEDEVDLNAIGLNLTSTPRMIPVS